MRLAKFKISASLGFLQKGTYVLNTLVKTDPHMKSNKYTISMKFAFMQNPLTQIQFFAWI